MSETVRFFRDTLSVDRGLISRLERQPRPGDTLLLAGRHVTLVALMPEHDYVIAADHLVVAPQAATAITGVPGNPTPSVTVLARTIEGAPLAISSTGMSGSRGVDGEDGESGIVHPEGGGRPIIGPGGDGENGEDGEDGGAGGSITVRFSVAAQVPTGSAPGGRGGAGGKGGRGGAGRPRGTDGKNGRSGRTGGSGPVDIASAGETDVWRLLDAASAVGWAAYRAEVAGYFFRKFDPGSQLFALEESQAALLVNPADPVAVAVRDGIANRQIPSGLARDLDIAPDFRSLSGDLTAEIAVVQNSFLAYVGVVQLATIADAILENLRLMAVQLAHRRLEAQAEVAIAQQDVLIAQAERENVRAQIKDIDNQIEEIRQERFSIGGIISDVASIATVVGGLASGIGAIISIPAALVTLERVFDENMDLVTLLKFLDEVPDPKSRTSDDIQELKKLGGKMEDLLKGTKSLISIGKVLADLDSAMSLPGQDAIGRLLKQQVLLVRQALVGEMRERQARSRVAAAELRHNNLGVEIELIQRRVDHWSADEATLEAATDLLIRAARDIVDTVMEDVFIAQRAREIYQLERAGGLRFDFGFLHPDEDRDSTPPTRASASLTVLSGMAIQVLAWEQIFKQLNAAQIGFDVIHPQLSVAISDASKLRDFAGGGAIEFSIELADVPEKMFELKVNALSLEVVGASATESVNIWITHSGQWSMNRRTDGTVSEMLLLPRSELFACSPGAGTLRAKIPANPQSSEPGPPFSFWGRGVATTFRLQLAQPSVIDLSQLQAINVLVDCIGYAVQGGGGITAVHALCPQVRSAPASSPPVVRAVLRGVCAGPADAADHERRRPHE